MFFTQKQLGIIKDAIVDEHSRLTRLHVECEITGREPSEGLVNRIEQCGEIFNVIKTEEENEH
tara:strand:- start:2045 stop:2233 length:189 start_codon:yes stop_codon:yes gene_type:complete